MASEAIENQDQQMYVPLSKTRTKRKFYRNGTNTMLKLKKGDK